jgi:hypothetical protein
MSKQYRATTKSLRHPYAAIEHRVLDSPAYADLGFSARSLLTLLARQLTKDNNGHLQAAFTYCNRYGFGSEHTVTNAIQELIAHGFIYRTRSHGANKVWARYAVTWLSITKRDNLYLDGFQSAAWRSWEQMLKKKAPRKKCRNVPADNAVSPPIIQQKMQEAPRQEMPTMN